MTPTRIAQLASEEETRLMDSVFLANGAAKRTVIFTSPERYSGCSWVAAQAARRLAQRVSGSVCLIDANLRWPSLHHLFGLENQRGLLQAAMQEHAEPIRNFAERIGRTNLWVLPSGGSTDLHEALLSEAIKAKLIEVAREFDYILIDAPAVRVSMDSSWIGPADGIVLVIAANSTTRDTAQNTKGTLEGANIPILGVVLNKRAYPIPDSIYQYL